MQIVNKLKLVPVKEIKPYHRNVRINERTVEELVNVIPEVGFNVPILLDRSNVIVKGHARWKAAIQLGLESVPCVYTDADPERVKLDRLVDNKIVELSTWDDDLLPSELASLNLDFKFDLEALGFQIAIPAATPADGNAGPDPSQPFVSDADIKATIPTDNDQYEKVICNKCGNVMLMRKS
jgi:ParB-like chromosome segregation protein Spo0J